MKPILNFCPDLLNHLKPSKKKHRFKSRFFDVKMKNGKYSLRVKRGFKRTTSFQQRACRYFKRGLYKLYLEELNRQEGRGFEKQYDFIRAFVRYNIGDFPIIYFNRRIGLIYLKDDEGENPRLLFDRMTYLFTDYGFTEIEFLGHVFGFPISTTFDLQIQQYLLESMKRKRELFKGLHEVRLLTDIDLAMNFMDS